MGRRRGARPDGGIDFFGAASALARAENLGVAFFIDKLPSDARRVVNSMGALLVTIIAFYVAFNAMKMGWLTTGQTSAPGFRWNGRSIRWAPVQCS